MKTFLSIGYTIVPSGVAPTTPRVGLIFYDDEIGSYLRWSGEAWSPVALT